MVGPDNQLFYDAFKASPIGIAVETLEGQPIFANPALCSMLGFSEKEMCGKHCVQFSPPEDAEKDWALFQQLRSGSIDHYQIEKRYFRRDGSLVWGRLSISLLNSRPSPLVLALVEDISDKIEAEEARRRHTTTVENIGRKIIAAQDQERTRIARELHDDIGQRLALLAVEFEQLQENPTPFSSGFKRRVQQLQKQIIGISGDVQSLSHELHSARLEYLGLVAAASSWCKEFGKRQKMEIRFRSHGVPRSLPSEISLCLFRVLQEAVHNAAKHSGAKSIEVRVWKESGEINLMVRDQGKGFDIESAMRGPGLGLTSMHERVRMVNGTFVIRSKPMGGNTVHVRIPFPGRVHLAAG